MAYNKMTQAYFLQRTTILMNRPAIDRGGMAIMSISIDLTNEGIVGKEVTGATTPVPYIIPVRWRN